MLDMIHSFSILLTAILGTLIYLAMAFGLNVDSLPPNVIGYTVIAFTVCVVITVIFTFTRIII